MGALKARKLILFCIFFISIIYYVANGEFEVVSPATGVVSGGTKNIDIISPSSGFISYFDLAPGKRIKQGDSIIKFDNLDDFFQQKTYFEKIKNLKKIKKLLTTEDIANKVIIKHEYLNGFESIFKTKSLSNIFLNKVASDYNSIVFHNLSFKKYSSLSKQRLSILTERSVLMERKIHILKKSRRPEVELIDALSSLSTIKEEVLTLNIDLDEKEKNINTQKAKYKSELIESSQQLKRKIIDVTKELDDSMFMLELATSKNKANQIKAPIDGVILEVKKNFQKGTYIEKSENLLTLKPTEKNNVIKAEISTEYKPFVEVGSIAKIKIRTQRFHDELIGEVMSITSDSFLNEDESSRHYNLDITFNNPNIKSNLIGLEADIFIVSRKVSLLNYMLATIGSNLYLNEW